MTDVWAVNHVENNTWTGTLCGLVFPDDMKLPEPEYGRTECWLCYLAAEDIALSSSPTPTPTSSSPADTATN